jgi:septal ring factor EnvC (AmiA/AmiB activator)
MTTKRRLEESQDERSRAVDRLDAVSNELERLDGQIRAWMDKEDHLKAWERELDMKERQLQDLKQSTTIMHGAVLSCMRLQSHDCISLA